MKKTALFLLIALMFAVTQLHAFCGFYVAGAGAELYNEASQVILVRDGLKTVITMQNDYKGNVKDFAMVVPVPVVLQRDQIRIADPNLFAYLDKYTSPRMAEYYDSNPCQQRMYMSSRVQESGVAMNGAGVNMVPSAKKHGVTIEAQYAVGEYDILILSAKDSGGLETWLKANGYHIPDDAKEVLAPYVKNNLKFFVVKINLEKQEKQGFTALRPIQISYEHERFMLPIRLGMANAKGWQDLIVYAFTRAGRVETANYRTAKIPTNDEVPPRIKTEFGKFYTAVFEKAWSKEGKKAVMLEYAWDLSSSNFTKCDPCATDPMTLAQIQEAGVTWITATKDRRGWGSADYDGELFITRLHARYHRSHYPEDLGFVNTPNKENFQGRYVIRHPSGGDLTCDAGKHYLAELKNRQQKEEATLAQLTGWREDGRTYYNDADEDGIGLWGNTGGGNNRPPELWLAVLGLALMLVVLFLPKQIARLSAAKAVS